MPAVNIDFEQVTECTLDAADTDGALVAADVVVIPVAIPVTAVADWLALYDPSSGTSPAAADGRVIARAVLDALSRWNTE